MDGEEKENKAAMSEQIAQHIARFFKSGGKVEDVGNRSGINLNKRTRREQVEYIKRITRNKE
jgi:hypothetical protein